MSEDFSYFGAFSQFLWISFLTLVVLAIFMIILVTITRTSYKMKLRKHKNVIQAQNKLVIGFFHP